MNPELITRVVNLVQKSGDKVVLADPVSGKAVVVLDLDAYEQMVQSMSAALAADTVPEQQSAPESFAPPSLPVAPAAPQPVPTFRQQSITPPAPPVRGPVSSDQLASAFGIPPAGSKKQPRAAENNEHGEEETPKKGIKVTPETMGTTHIMADLTQEQLIDKINRDIGAWKTAQERRRTDELKAAVTQNPQPATVGNTLEDEERFFLEPIE